jgi:(p)ppGpp synthase/HD superfamily hydrolase
MAYFVFGKNLDNVSNTIYRIAENISDLNNLNITQDIYKIIEDSQSNFNSVKLGSKTVDKYNNNTITYIDLTISVDDKNELQNFPAKGTAFG